jgi:hypothetical protein
MKTMKYALILAICASFSQSSVAAEEGFVRLDNGKDLSG